MKTIKLSFFGYENLSGNAKQKAIEEMRQDEYDNLTSKEEIIIALNDCIFKEDGTRIKPNTKLILR